MHFIFYSVWCYDYIAFSAVDGKNICVWNQQCYTHLIYKQHRVFLSNYVHLINLACTTPQRRKLGIQWSRQEPLRDISSSSFMFWMDPTRGTCDTAAKAWCILPGCFICCVMLYLTPLIISLIFIWHGSATIVTSFSFLLWGNCIFQCNKLAGIHAS